MKTSASVFLLIAIVVCIAVRTLHSGWGRVGPVGDPDRSVRLGIAANPDDYLTYSSWAQQARSGAWTFSDLCTTTEHSPSYFNPFFLIVGRLSQAFSVSPELILNLSIFVSLAIFVYSLNSACGRLGYGGLTTFCVLCLCFGGGGVAWIRRVVEALGLNGRLRTVGPGSDRYHCPDWFYGELFPLISFNVSPFHSMSLAVLALIVALLIRYDDAERRLSWLGGALLIGASAFLVGIRPYEPIVLITAYGTYLAYSLLSSSSASALKKRFAMFGCLFAGIVPFLLYDFWLTRQPVWSEFSQKGLSLFGTADWAGAFLVLWALATAGIAVLGTRAWEGPYALLVVWCSIYAAILLVLQSGLTKLCGGLTIPLSLLAGAFIQYYGQQLRSRRHHAIAAGLVVCLALGSATATLLRIVKAPPPRVSADLLVSLDAIRRDSSVASPAVLTDPATAMYLPGLAGFRVYCGNWGLTDDHDLKAAALANMGLHVAAPKEPSKTPAAPETAEQAALRKATIANLRDQIQKNVFAYLLIDKSYDVPELEQFQQAINRDFRKSLIYDGKTFCAIKLDPAIIEKITGLFRTTADRTQL